MVQKNQNRDRVLEVLYGYPSKGFSVRDIAKMAKVPSSSVQRYLENLRGGGLVDEENRVVVSNYLKFRKSYFMIDKLFSSGLIDYLIEELNPSLIVVFGSVRKGEYDFESDVDLFVESFISKKFDLGKFEKKLKHNVQLFVEGDINKLQENLFNNILNGIKLYGSFKVR